MERIKFVNLDESDFIKSSALQVLLTRDRSVTPDLQMRQPPPLNAYQPQSVILTLPLVLHLRGQMAGGPRHFECSAVSSLPFSRSTLVLVSVFVISTLLQVTAVIILRKEKHAQYSTCPVN